MLLAEIHGKRCPDVEGSEDMLTSAVFGHLRLVPPTLFWMALFGRAHLNTTGHDSLALWLQRRNADLRSYEHVKLDFWHGYEGYGEPDLIVTFTCKDKPSVIVVIEVKLDSGKSSTGVDDQLARYLRLLDDSVPETTKAGDCLCSVVFLTRAYVKQEIEDSIKQCRWTDDARERVAGLEWNDVLETARNEARRTNDDYGDMASVLLHEVADFLERRGMAAFRGFKLRSNSAAHSSPATGRFFQHGFFRWTPRLSEASLPATGRFYA